MIFLGFCTGPHTLLLQVLKEKQKDLLSPMYSGSDLKKKWPKFKKIEILTLIFQNWYNKGSQKMY
jgi:hypothetical protein